MPEGSLILPTRFCPPPAYYKEMARHSGPVVIDTAARFDKRCKQAHRCAIADARGPLDITVPIAKPYGRTWDRVAVSLHDQWWETARTALESAYGRTPYFEFYADDFLPLLQPDRFSSVAALNRDFDTAIRRCLQLPAEVTYEPLNSPDAREPEPADIGPYWQVRQDRFGYLPGLSTLDLLFNLGPESLLKIMLD